MVSADAPKGVVSDECKTLVEAKTVVEETNAPRIEVAGKMFALYKNLLSEDARSKWSTIVASQIGANPWTDLKGKVHNLACDLSVQSFEDCHVPPVDSLSPRRSRAREELHQRTSKEAKPS